MGDFLTVSTLLTGSGLGTVALRAMIVTFTVNKFRVRAVSEISARVTLTARTAAQYTAVRPLRHSVNERVFNQGLPGDHVFNMTDLDNGNGDSLAGG